MIIISKVIKVFQRFYWMRQLSRFSVKQDTTYLQESSNYYEMRQSSLMPTIVSTGSKVQDDLIESTMPIKNMGKSLVNLPLTIKEFQDLLNQNKTETSARDLSFSKERKYDEQLDQQFKMVEKFKQGQNQKFLRIKSRNSIDPTSRTSIRNPNEDRKKIEPSSDLLLDPKNIDVKPNQLVTVNDALLKKYGKGTLFKTNQGDKSKQLNSYGMENLVQGSSHENLGQPSARQDAIMLINWFQHSLNLINRDVNEQKVLQKQSLTQVVFNLCIEEICRQVSVQCVERGELLRKIFDQYTQLIENMSKNFKAKRVEIKKKLSDKVQEYIKIQDELIEKNNHQMQELKRNIEMMSLDLQESQTLLSQRGTLIQKLKKKCFNVQKEAETAARKFKLIEKENYELVQKCYEQAEKLGEVFVSPIDEDERKRLILIIDQEMQLEWEARDQEQKKEATDLNKSLQSVENEFNQMIAINDIIQEEEKQTDMDDFIQYLKSINIDKFIEIECQTEVIRHRSVAINAKPHKIGIMRDKETFTDPRLLEQSKFDSNSTTPNKNAKIPMLQRLTTRLPQLIEDLDESMTDSSFSNQQNTNEDEEDQDQELKINDDEAIMNDIKRQKILEIRRRNTVIGAHDLINSLEIELNEMDSQENLDIYNDSLGESQGQNRKSPQKIQSSMNFGGIVNLRSFQIGKQQKNNTIMDVYVKKARDRIKNLLQSESMTKLLSDEEHKDFMKKLVEELKYTSKEVQHMGDEMSKREKQLKFLDKLNRRMEKELTSVHEKIDNLEMDNYMLREQVSELAKQLEEYKNIIDEILQQLESQEMNKVLQADLKMKLLGLSDRIAQSYMKAMHLLSDDDAAYMMNSKNQSRENILDDDEDKIQELIDGRATAVQDGQNLDLDFESDKSANEGGKSSNKKDKSGRRKTFKFQLFNLGRKRMSRVRKQGSHPAQVMLKKLINKDPKNLKDQMPRKMLLRLIYQMYSERGFLDHLMSYQMSQIQPKQGQQQFTGPQVQLYQPSLLEWVYENFLNKYGLKNVAEKKFKQMISSCVCQKGNLPRIRLFGRFIEVHNELQPTDFAKYLEMLDLFTNLILNFKIDDDIEIILLPNKALDYFKSKFETKYPQKILTQKLQKMKVPVSNEDMKKQKHLKTVREALDFDEFAEFILDNLQSLQDEREQIIRDVFLAVDINNDGYMSYLEFKMMMKSFYEYTSKQIWDLFEEYGKTGLEKMNPFIKYINIESFVQMGLEKDLFDAKSQKRYMNSNDTMRDFENLSKTISSTASIFKARLKMIDMGDDYELLSLIDDFQQCIKDPFSPKVALLCYKIVDNHLKNLYIKKMAEIYMPIRLQDIGIKVKPNILLKAI
ncbi:ef hand family protein [Stylonychia lemnae]|uniref:Ef hand family protein n=1 Tax=Stylonychia lemnae TaxID=5949 RepID=A0A078B107_STYLE|nr:ef hand family protein [Stylonychia lemnae]|eukprot:CDW88315.1 ef hand family protein [Stylonychia lemnae]